MGGAFFMAFSFRSLNIRPVKQNKWKFKILLLLMVLAFAELCGYAAMYLASHPTPYMSYGDYFKIRKNLLGEADTYELPRYTPAPSLNYIPTPNYEYGGKQQHCADGYRGEQVLLKKEAGTLRILCLGGSTTYGSAVPYSEQTYPAHLQNMLNANISALPFSKVEVINGGTEAATSAEELAYYHFKFRYYNPDIIVLHTGGNDGLTGPKDPRYQPDHSHFRNIAIGIPELPLVAKLFMRSYWVSFISINLYYRPLVAKNFVLSAQDDPNYIDWYDPEGLDTNINADGFYNNIDLLLSEIERDGHHTLIMPFIINEAHEFSQQNPDYVARVNEINQLLSELTDKYHATWIPFTKATIRSNASWQDDCHLDEAGEKEKAQLVQQVLTAYFTDSTSM